MTQASTSAMLIYLEWVKTIEDPDAQRKAMIELLGDIIREQANHEHLLHSADCVSNKTLDK